MIKRVGPPAGPAMEPGASSARPGRVAGSSVFAHLLGPGKGGKAAEVAGARRPAPGQEDGPHRPAKGSDPVLAAADYPWWPGAGMSRSPPHGSPASPGAGGAPQAGAPAAAALQELWPALVRRVAWEGDGWRGSMRLELGSGALSGATLLLRCDDGRVHVRLSAPGGADLDAWRARIAARLASAGLAVDGVD